MQAVCVSLLLQLISISLYLRCGVNVRQKIGVTETTVLHSHTTTCQKRIKGVTLHGFGFTGGTRLSEQEVRESWALWIAHHARPYVIVSEHHVSPSYYLPYNELTLEFKLPNLLHPDALAHKPSRKTLSADIKRLYEVTQQHIRVLLAVRRLTPSYCIFN